MVPVHKGLQLQALVAVLGLSEVDSVPPPAAQLHRRAEAEVRKKEI